MRARSSILITGASSGIGQALALHFAQQGHLVLAGVRRREDADELISRSQGRVTPIRLDVTSAASIEAALAQVQAHAQAHTGEQLDVLINNAGLAFSGALEQTPQDELTRLMNVNVMGTFAVTRACLPLLRQAQGHIVNISSISGLFAAPGLTAYVASKHAVEGMTAALRMELAPLGVKVCSIAPGKIDTPIWDKALHTTAAIQARNTQNTAQNPAQNPTPAFAPTYAPHYQTLDTFYQRYAHDERGTPMAAVIKAVEKALRSNAPKARYIVGRNARLRACLNWLPTAWRERLILNSVARAVS